MPDPKRLHVITWGCQMNVYDSARMADTLAPLGYAPASGPDDADMVILNTCHIRERAAEKVFSELGRLRVVKEARTAAGKRTVLAVAGCVAQAEGDALLRRAPFVDIVMGPQAYHRLPEMVARASRAAGAVIDVDFATVEKFDALPEQAASQGLTAFLTVQEGCDKFCSFCVVPYTRGAEMSRPAAAVLAEARRMVAGGTREITLLGQNVNAWAAQAPDGGRWGLAELVRALAAIPGLLRLRYTTSHPRDMHPALIAAHRDMPQLMPFLHLPVQSGSDRMLAAMNRRHTADEYRRLVDRLRGARPDLALSSSDFIVGHPGETDADHAATMALVREVGFAQAFSFKYSRPPRHPRRWRPGPGGGGGEGRPAAGVAGRAARQPGRLQRKQRRAGRSPSWSPGPAAAPGSSAGAPPRLQPVHFPGPFIAGGRGNPGDDRCHDPHIAVWNPGRGVRLRLTQPCPGPRRDHPARPARPRRDHAVQ